MSPGEMRTPSELPSPEALAENDRRRRAARGIVARSEDAALQRAHADGVEERSAHPQGVGEARLTARGEVDPIGAPDSELREGLLLGPDALPERRGELRPVPREVAAPADPRCDADVVELLRTLDREPAQAHRVEELEDGRVGADPERERKDRDEREERLETQAPRAVAEVLEKTGKPAGAGTVFGRREQRGARARNALRPARPRAPGRRARRARTGELSRAGSPVRGARRNGRPGAGRSPRRWIARGPDRLSVPRAARGSRATSQACSASVIRCIASTNAAQALLCARSILRPSAVSR